MSERALSAETMDGVIDRLADVLRDELSSIQLPPPVVRAPEWLRAAAAALRDATGQVALLRTLLTSASEAGARTALFVVKQDRIEGWEGVGFDDLDFHGLELSPDDPALAALLVEQRPIVLGGETGLPAPDFGQSPRSPAVLVPIQVHGKLVAIVYADAAEHAAAVDTTALEVLGEVGGLAIERLALSRWTQRSGEGAHAESPARAVETSPPTLSQPVGSIPTASTPEAPAALSGPFGPPTGPEHGPGPVSPEVQDARRFARLLMEEICLYHADKVDEGRAQANLLSRLADQVERARQMYEQRVPAEVRGLGDFFDEALVRVLAAGDANALGRVDRAAI
ncbi:MAG: hypothetical protein MUE47_02195 [Acidobacteria bacterium]|jgi:hypothetical protein|nr:hypothetical protein [Acidobacteriota bacterium]